MAAKKKRSLLKKGPNRNALCPCGSGRAFKNCCAEKRRASSDKPESLPNQFKRMAVGLVVCLLVAGGIALAVMRPWENSAAGDRQPAGYDADNDRYWHDDHGHWHEGRPPAEME